ncbi:MAG: hypothetical protein LBV16_06455 [Elusimicrobiota bacterium]|jgi:CDP-glycerol glycerophosphotransferase|nr:hypothetical protein [Elusimicrobiota bacterium]
MNFIKLEEAQKRGYKELYFTWMGIGDNLALLTAAEMKFAQSGERTLVGTNLPQIYENCNSVDIIKGFSFDEIKNNEKLLSVLDTYGISPVFISALQYIESFDNPGKFRTLLADMHFFARYCQLRGISGKIQIVPQFFLTDEEKKFGRFFKNNQIAIMSNGILKYKTFPISKMQELIDKLKDKYNFVQIGGKKDEKLKNALDCRGKYSIRQAASILHNSDLFIGCIGGLMHLARAVSCRSVIAYSSAESLIYDSYPCNKNVSPINACNFCGLRQKDPREIVCYDNYSCIKNITVEDMLNAVEESLSQKDEPLEIETADLKIGKANGLKLYLQMKNGIGNLHIWDAKFGDSIVEETKKEVRILGIFKLDIVDSLKKIY